MPDYAKVIPQFIAKAIYDGAVTYRYITDAEVRDVKIIIIKPYSTTTLNIRRLFCKLYLTFSQ